MNYNYGSMAILGIGKVNLNTAGNSMFGKILDCWSGSNKETNIVVRHIWNSKKMMVVHTSAHPDNVVKDYTTTRQLEFHHDQSCRRIEGVWQVIGVVPHTIEGLTKIKEITGVNTISFYTFK